MPGEPALPRSRLRPPLPPPSASRGRLGLGVVIHKPRVVIMDDILRILGTAAAGSASVCVCDCCSARARSRPSHPPCHDPQRHQGAQSPLHQLYAAVGIK